jgi:hypothetical protein
LGQNSRHNQKVKVSQKQKKKTQGETWKCIDFGVSSNFTLFFYVSLPCTLTIGSLFLVLCDKTAISFISEKCFKLQVWGPKLRMWGLEFLSEWQLLWTRNIWSCELWMWRFKVWVWGVKFLSERMWRSWVSGLRVKFLN